MGKLVDDSRDALEGREVHVLGAGIGGLAAAVALARRGATVTVLERAGEITEVGAGIQVSPNGFAVLRALGLGPAFAAATVRGRAVELREGASARRVFRLNLDQGSNGAGADYYFVHRADIVDLLADAARTCGVGIRLLQEVTQVSFEGDRAQVTTRQGQNFNPAVLVGAEGLHSPTRIALNGSDAPFFTHQVAWRALVTPDAPVAVGAAQATVYMGPGRHLVTYPLRGGSLLNIVAVEERRAWAAEGWAHEDDPENLRHAFAGFCPEVRSLLARIDRVHLWGLFRHPVAPSWHRGRAAILGDAAHPTLPFLAQGANIALEDAWVLANSLARAGSVEAGFARYQDLRRARTVRVIDAASRNARNYHLRPSPLRFAAHAALRLGSAVAPGMALRKFDWLYGHDVTA